MTKGRWTAAVILAVLTLATSVALLYLREHRGDIPAEGPAVGSIRLFQTPQDLPEFQLQDLDGNMLSSSDWKGKVVLLNFWATWCPPCRAEIPDLIKLQEKYRDQLVIVGISEDEGPIDEVKKFVADSGMNYPVAMSSVELRKLFRGVVVLPTTFVIDPDGKLQQRHAGMLNAANTEAETRYLAGIDTSITVERVESDEKARLANAEKANNIPGIDLASLSEAQRKAVVQALIAEQCTCGCMLTVAECRLEDPTCPVSLPLAQNIVKSYSAAP
jgi:thiol-disulfide isomerase/thioredoxin